MNQRLLPFTLALTIAGTALPSQAEDCYEPGGVPSLNIQCLQQKITIQGQQIQTLQEQITALKAQETNKPKPRPELPLIPTNCTINSFENHNYLICKGHLNYIESIEECTRFNMNLSHIDSIAENKFVVDSALGAFGCNYPETSYWISNLKSTTQGSSWWADGEPNGDGNNIHILRFCGQPYGWNDIPGDYSHEYGWVCEQ